MCDPHLCRKKSRRDGVAEDMTRAEVDGEVLYEADDAVLGGGVRGYAVRAGAADSDASDGGSGDDAGGGRRGCVLGEEGCESGGGRKDGRALVGVFVLFWTTGEGGERVVSV